MSGQNKTYNPLKMLIPGAVNPLDPYGNTDTDPLSLLMKAILSGSRVQQPYQSQPSGFLDTIWNKSYGKQVYPKTQPETDETGQPLGSLPSPTAVTDTRPGILQNKSFLGTALPILIAGLMGGTRAAGAAAGSIEEQKRYKDQLGLAKNKQLADLLEVAMRTEEASARTKEITRYHDILAKAGEETRAQREEAASARQSQAYDMAYNRAETAVRNYVNSLPEGVPIETWRVMPGVLAAVGTNLQPGHQQQLITMGKTLIEQRQTPKPGQAPKLGSIEEVTQLYREIAQKQTEGPLSPEQELDVREKAYNLQREKSSSPWAIDPSLMSEKVRKDMANAEARTENMRLSSELKRRVLRPMPLTELTSEEQALIKDVADRAATGQITIQSAIAAVNAGGVPRTNALFDAIGDRKILPTAVRTRITDVENGKLILKNIEDMVDRINREPDIVEKIKWSVNLAEYMDSMGTIYARSLGERGVVTDWDVKRATGFVPNWRKANFAPGWAQEQIDLMKATQNRMQTVFSDDYFKQFPYGQDAPSSGETEKQKADRIFGPKQ